MSENRNSSYSGPPSAACLNWVDVEQAAPSSCACAPLGGQHGVGCPLRVPMKIPAVPMDQLDGRLFTEVEVQQRVDAALEARARRVEGERTAYRSGVKEAGLRLASYGEGLLDGYTIAARLVRDGIGGEVNG